MADCARDAGRSIHQMKPRTIMVIAGDPSGDRLAAELVTALRREILAASQDTSADVQPLRTPLAPRFFGAGGPEMAAAGVELAFDLTQFAVIGVTGVLKSLPNFLRMLRQLRKLAIEQQPELIIGVDFSGFNLRLARAIKDHVRKHHAQFTPWNPRLVQFVLPQVWASRAWRAFALAENYDLLLGIIPFERAWYAQRFPGLNMHYVGHPIVERLAEAVRQKRRRRSEAPCVLLLPGSRSAEVQRHGPLVLETFALLRNEFPALRAKLILPNEKLAQAMRQFAVPAAIEIQVGSVTDALADADLAIAKSGTVTMECAMFGVPAVVFYQVSALNSVIVKQFLTVKHIGLPNLIAGREVFPEFLQSAATPDNLARAALKILRDSAHRQAVQSELARVVAALGSGGATTRAAQAITALLP